jgi:hypothetical protein
VRTFTTRYDAEADALEVVFREVGSGGVASSRRALDGRRPTAGSAARRSPGKDASRNHVLAIHAGGLDTPDNVRLAHISCNSSRGSYEGSGIARASTWPCSPTSGDAVREQEEAREAYERTRGGAR